MTDAGVSVDGSIERPTGARRPPRKRNQRGEGERLRTEIIEAAMRLLDERPNLELSLRMVAKEAGITPPSIYAHFESREAMVVAVIRSAWEGLGLLLEEAAEQAAAEGPVAQLRAQIKAYVGYAMRRASRYQLLFAIPAVKIEAGSFPTRPVEPAYTAIIKVMRRCIAEGLRVPLGADTAAVLLLSVAHGRVALAHTLPEMPWNGPDEVEAVLQRALDELIVRSS